MEESRTYPVPAGRLYPADFRTERPLPVLETQIRVTEGDVTAVAREEISHGRTAVLHFADVRTSLPMGKIGAASQEDRLRAATELGECLRSGDASREFYARYAAAGDPLAFLGVLCHRNLTVYAAQGLLPEEARFSVDVISCPAPDVTGLAYTNRAVLGREFARRIRTVLEIALDNGARGVILGAFGCGGCGNDPKLVAEAFRSVLVESRYRSAFSRVIFAVKSSVGGDPYTVCPNLAAFEMAFCGASRELEKLRYVGGPQTDPGAEDVPMPGGRIRYRGSESRAYHRWCRENRYFGKQFSVLGDSISTLQGFNPRGNPVFYEGAMKEKAGVREMTDTWWGKVINFFGGELLVNNSWSGCRVTRLEGRTDPYPSACSPRRTGNLHVGDVLPDVILVYLGFNDWGDGVLPLPVVEAPPEIRDRFFAYAYARMLRQLRESYPGAEIWCATLNRSYASSNPRFRFPDAFGGIHILEYNRVIRDCARETGCRLLDLEAQHCPYDAVDGTHPNGAGMEILAALVVRQMADEAGCTLLDCELNHEVVDGTCRRCGRRLTPEKTHQTVLQLRIRETEQHCSFSGDQVQVGRSRENDLWLDDPYVARNQASFVRAQGQWCIRDNGSRNGTYLNGIRLEPHRLCRLRIGDEISFARRVTAVVLS